MKNNIAEIAFIQDRSGSGYATQGRRKVKHRERDDRFGHPFKYMILHSQKNIRL